MLDQQDGGAGIAADLLQQRIEGERFTRIETRRGLVQAEKLRPGTHCAGDLEPPLSAIGQVAGRIVGPLGQRCLFEPVPGELDRFLDASR